MMCGSEKDIHVIKLEEETIKDRVLEILDGNKMNYQEINPGANLHNIIYESYSKKTLMAFETFDN
jgi:hypothetical protein